jgi:hypothetical protein
VCSDDSLDEDDDFDELLLLDDELDELDELLLLDDELDDDEADDDCSMLPIIAEYSRPITQPSHASE